eukprot:c23124_g2_i1 orf=175-399(+)
MSCPLPATSQSLIMSMIGISQDVLRLKQQLILLTLCGFILYKLCLNWFKETDFTSDTGTMCPYSQLVHHKMCLN